MRLSTKWSALALGCIAGLAACGKSNRNMILNKGSSTMGEVAQKWAEVYQEVDPTVAVSVNASGSGTGIASLIDGTVDIANSSRRMKPDEIEKARANNVEPVEHIVGYDAIGIYVHKDNPIESFTFDQLAQIYGKDGTITKWSQLGVQIPGAKSDEIRVVGRDNSSGTYEYFREAVLGKDGDYRLDIMAMHGARDVAEQAAKSPSVIGYSGIAYADDHVRLVPLVGKKPGSRPVTPSIDSTLDGSYPLARPLLMYTIGEEHGKVKEYLDWIKSDQGQRILLDLGYPPLRKVD